ncbi:MAG: hypothetical protein VYA34_02940 [Myxococcota bacterium]|nr:hypothetical protein [Myxococcota bacterium]
MSLKYFSQFMMVEGFIDREQLDAALERGGLSHKSFGQLAIEAGYITASEAAELNREQMRRDVPFGQLAIEQGFLTEEKLEVLLQAHKDDHQALVEQLVALGHLKDGEAKQALEDFWAQFPVRIAPEHLAHLADFEGHRPALFVADVFARLAMRLTRIHLKLAGGCAFGDTKLYEYCAAITLKGEQSVTIGLSTDGVFASEVIRGMTRIMSGDENINFGGDKGDFEDLLGGFLDIVGGHTIAGLEIEGVNLEMGTPVFGKDALGGEAFELVSGCGKAVLTLERG